MTLAVRHKPVTSIIRQVSAVLAMACSAALLTSLTTPTPASAATQATYYVAPNGDDANAGTITAPFKTLQHARDVVRTVDRNMTGDINVYLRGGNYPVSSRTAASCSPCPAPRPQQALSSFRRRTRTPTANCGRR